jgi:aminoglycoside 2''-phosphotransferase
MLHHETRVIDLVSSRTDLQLPHYEVLEPDFGCYRLLAGAPLTRELLLRSPAATRSAVLKDVVLLVRALHEIKPHELAAASIGPSDTNRDRGWWLSFYNDLRDTVFPHLMQHQRLFVDEHFAPVVSGEIALEYEPRLIHGDLAPYHLLFDQDKGRLAGVIDFGTAGLGDPAVDIAALLHTFGESLLAPAIKLYPEMVSWFDRARFCAGTLELQWALHSLRHQDQDLAFAHLGGARDMMPVGSPLPEFG